MLPEHVASAVETHLGTRVGGAERLRGGCIANASRLVTSDGPLFVKWSRGGAADTFSAEAAGLRALRQGAVDLIIPEPLLVLEAEPPVPGLLVLEWIEPGTRGDGFWERFGRALAELHCTTGHRYGFESDNFIGRLPQQNEWHASWPDFFARMRLEPQVRMARDAGRWNSGWSAHLERLMGRVDELLPTRPEPSILHGDLWGGNYIAAEDGRAALVDPAAYYGHRETDLAMSELFGGFDARFHDAYREAWALEAGYDVRREVYNLYHLINHLNHFGSGYAGSVGRILKRY